MSNIQSNNYITDHCHLKIPCHFNSRGSLKSHSSTCLSNPYDSQSCNSHRCCSKHEEFPRLLASSPRDEEDEEDEEAALSHPKKRSRKRKKKKRVFSMDMVPTAKVVIVSAKHHRCRLHRNRSGRQRLHSDSSCRTKRGSVVGGTRPEHSRRARFAIITIAFALILLSVFLVGFTLRMAPIIDELVRKENEELYRSMSSGTSTSAPVPNGSSVVDNATVTTNGQPG